MEAIEKRARELLAAHLPKGSGFWRAPLLDPQYPADYFPDTYQAAINAIVAALTPPEGYVLVDAKLLGAVRVARLAILQKEAEAEQMDEPHDASMWAECAADLDAIAPRGVLAARPEVKT